MALIALNGSGPQALSPPGPLVSFQYRALGGFFLHVDSPFRRFCVPVPQFQRGRASVGYCPRKIGGPWRPRPFSALLN
jgi:hypothetical protein